MSVEKLKPCPFCGDKNPYIEYVEPHKHVTASFMPDKTDWSAFVSCSSCSCMLATNGETEKKATDKIISLWNKRGDK